MVGTENLTGALSDSQNLAAFLFSIRKGDNTADFGRGAPNLFINSISNIWLLARQVVEDSGKPRTISFELRMATNTGRSAEYLG
jgi:hypothetical protein